MSPGVIDLFQMVQISTDNVGPLIYFAAAEFFNLFCETSQIQKTSQFIIFGNKSKYPVSLTYALQSSGHFLSAPGFCFTDFQIMQRKTDLQADHIEKWKFFLLYIACEQTILFFS